MARKQFRVPLDPPRDPEQLNQLRAHIATERGQVIEFMMQYETWIDGAWRPVVRYDSAHGQAHRDLLDPRGETLEKDWLPSHYSFADALNYAEQDLQDN